MNKLDEIKEKIDDLIKSISQSRLNSFVPNHKCELVRLRPNDEVFKKDYSYQIRIALTHLELKLVIFYDEELCLEIEEYLYEKKKNSKPSKFIRKGILGEYLNLVGGGIKNSLLNLAPFLNEKNKGTFEDLATPEMLEKVKVEELLKNADCEGDFLKYIIKCKKESELIFYYQICTESEILEKIYDCLKDKKQEKINFDLLGNFETF